MSKKLVSNKGSCLSSALRAIVALLLVVFFTGAVYFLYKGTDGFTSSKFTAYYAVSNEVELKNNSAIAVKQADDLRVDIVDRLSIFDKTRKVDYTVQILPKKEVDFTFDYCNQTYSFFALGDLSSCFNLIKNNNYFTISVASWDMQYILSKMFSDLVLDSELDADVYFQMLITINKKEQLLIDLEAQAEDISFSEDEVIYD